MNNIVWRGRGEGGGHSAGPPWYRRQNLYPPHRFHVETVFRFPSYLSPAAYVAPPCIDLCNGTSCQVIRAGHRSLEEKVAAGEWGRGRSRAKVGIGPVGFHVRICHRGDYVDKVREKGESDGMGFVCNPGRLVRTRFSF